ncbi:terminase small subunit [Cribrihabitans pelagius]|uniref:terminase small subunit n=1 Tax=Cribrihabitans pelagius TaxID=1765746 RepID=UPI003B5AD957
MAEEAETADAEAAAAEPLLNRSQIAQIFGVSENTIDKWRKKGMPVEGEGGNGVAYEFRFSDCKRWFEETKAREQAEKQAADDFVSQQRMEFLNAGQRDQAAGFSAGQRKEMAQAELVWMQAARARGALIHVDEVVELLDQIFGEFRAGLDGQPDWLEREFSLTGDQVERAVDYNDGILRSVQAKIRAAALGEDQTQVVDPLDGRLL